MTNIEELKKKYQELGEEIARLEKEKKLPESWEDFANINADRINVHGAIIKMPTKQLEKAREVLTKLTYLREEYRDGWEPDWTNANSYKYCIVPHEDIIVSAELSTDCRFLSFPTAEIRDKFLECFRSLIEEAKELL